MAPKARKRAAAGALKSETGASYSMMARAGGENSNHSIEREFQELADHETPYGRIVKRVDLQRDDNSYFRLAYACPFALFWYLVRSTRTKPVGRGSRGNVRQRSAGGEEERSKQASKQAQRSSRSSSRSSASPAICNGPFPKESLRAPKESLRSP